MTLEKKTRNKLIIELYNQGKSDKEILEELLKKGFDDYKKVGSVRMLLARLRNAGKISRKRGQPLTRIQEVGKRLGKSVKVQASKQTSKPAIQQVSKQEKKRPAKEVYDTATYYITKETKKKIKILAAEQDKEISQLVREIFKDYFDKH